MNGVWWWQGAAAAALGLALLALALLAVAPLGWRLGWWHFRFAFSVPMAGAGLVGAAAAVLALATLAAGWAGLDARGLAMALAAAGLGAVLAYVPWSYNRLRTALPRIHDITTDTAAPPPLAAVLPAREAEAAASAVYEGAELARLQNAAYPDIAPLEAPLSAERAFEAALATARAMPGWRIVAADAASGRIEGSQRSRWFAFTDDFVIRVAPAGAGARIDMRSISRQGRSDFGVNAARIRAFMGALRRRLG